jgi:hypothetical protein
MLARQEKPVMEELWSSDTPNSMIALRDIADAAAKVLNEREKHYLAEYSLSSTMLLSDSYVVDCISHRIGKKVEMNSFIRE